MAREVTKQIVSAFLAGNKLSVSNSNTDGNKLYLFGNLIAEKRNDGLYITNAGWKSATTLERLRALPNVGISVKKGIWYLNGKEWDGEWVNVKTGDKPDESNVLKSVAMVAAMGDILTQTKTDANTWKKRMFKAGLGAGIDFPEDWDSLSEDEKEKRLNNAINVIK